MPEPFANIAIVGRSILRFYVAGLAALLRERHGSDIHLYCTTAQEEWQYRTMDEANVFSSITVTEHLMPWPLPADLDPEAVTSRARAIEERYGVTLNYLMMTNRHHGRGFALGGFYHPRSRQSEEMDYIQTLHVYNEALEFWEREFSVKRISLQINGGTLDMIAARAHGIPVRSLTMARYKNNYSWLTDEFDHNAAIGEAFEKLGNRPPEHEDIELTLIHLTNRDRVLAGRSPFRLAKTLGHTTLRRAYHKLRGYKKAQTYLLGSMLASQIRQWQSLRKMTGRDVSSLASLTGKRFVFFPLHTEPERALQAMSPEYFYQLSCIAAIARDLPAGVLLAVKEHPFAVGRRPADFYSQIQEFKNVVMLDLREFGLEVVRQADALVTITSTAGLEAAALGKPVISFGRHNLYNFLPHVRLVTEETQLKQHLHDMLNGSFDRELAVADGARLMEAIRMTSFDIGRLTLFDPKNYTTDALEAGYRDLLASFRDRQATEPSAERSAITG